MDDEKELSEPKNLAAKDAPAAASSVASGKEHQGLNEQDKNAVEEYTTWVDPVEYSSTIAYVYHKYVILVVQPYLSHFVIFCYILYKKNFIVWLSPSFMV